jgi:hypothetical protein
MKTSLEGVDETRRFAHALDTINHVVDAFHGLVRPTHLRYEVADAADAGDEGPSTQQFTGDAELTAGEVLDAMRETADEMAVPSLAVFELTGSVRLTLADGTHLLSPTGDSGAIRSVSPSSDDTGAPLEVTLRQHGVMRPFTTETLTVTGHSDHWLDGRETNAYPPAPTPLARLNQSRLAGAVSQLYDAVSPTKLSFENFENADGLFTPSETIPGFDALWTRQGTEWVLSRFERHRPDPETLRLEYVESRLNPLVEFPDRRVRTFLETAIPADTDAPTTAVAAYPETSTTFEWEAPGWAVVDS